MQHKHLCFPNLAEYPPQFTSRTKKMYLSSQCKVLDVLVDLPGKSYM